MKDNGSKKGDPGIRELEIVYINVQIVLPIGVRFSNYRFLFTRIKKTKKTENQQKGTAENVTNVTKKRQKERLLFFCVAATSGITRAKNILEYERIVYPRNKSLLYDGGVRLKM